MAARPHIRKVFPVPFMLGMLVLGIAVGCSTTTESTQEKERTGSALAGLLPGDITMIEGPLSEDGLQAIFGTPDLGVGENRIGFVLTSPDELIREPTATVSSFYLSKGDSAGELKQTATAVFRPWPYGTRGLYTTRLTFETPGRWSMEISIPDADRPGLRAKLFFEVKEAPSAIAVGSPAVPSQSKTLNDVDRLNELTTGSLYDPDLYQVSIAAAVKNGLPTVVVMASPAFCTNAVCGPQVEVLRDLKTRYKGQANFIHVDIYDNPEEIQGDLTKARVSPAVVEWGLTSTEWSFVIDGDGIVSARFESFATEEELEQALQEVL